MIYKCVHKPINEQFDNIVIHFREVLCFFFIGKGAKYCKIVVGYAKH